MPVAPGDDNIARHQAWSRFDGIQTKLTRGVSKRAGKVSEQRRHQGAAELACLPVSFSPESNSRLVDANGDDPPLITAHFITESLYADMGGVRHVRGN